MNIAWGGQNKDHTYRPHHQLCMNSVGLRIQRDQIFLVIPDDSGFTARVPVILDTTALSWIINIIKESEMDWLSTPWARVRLAMGLGGQVAKLGSFQKPVVNRSLNPADLDEKVFTKDDEVLSPLQAESMLP